MNSVPVTKRHQYRDKPTKDSRFYRRQKSDESTGRSTGCRPGSARHDATSDTNTVAISSGKHVSSRSPRINETKRADINSGGKSPPRRPSAVTPMSPGSGWTDTADGFDTDRRRSICDGSEQPPKAPPASILAKWRRHSVAGFEPNPSRRPWEPRQTGSLPEVAPVSRISFPGLGSETFMEVLQGFQEELRHSLELSQSELETEEATDTRRRVHFSDDVRLE